MGDFDGNTLYNHGREFGLLVEIGKNIALKLGVLVAEQSLILIMTV